MFNLLWAEVLPIINWLSFADILKTFVKENYLCIHYQHLTHSQNCTPAFSQSKIVDECGLWSAWVVPHVLMRLPPPWLQYPFHVTCKLEFYLIFFKRTDIKPQLLFKWRKKDKYLLIYHLVKCKRRVHLALNKQWA